MKGRSVAYSLAEKAWLYDNRLLPISEYHAAFCATFRRDDVSAANIHAFRKRNGWKTGRTGQFAKGSEPHNKGVACPEGVGGRHPNARKTQFQQGNRTGRANDNYQPIGTERISKDGYRERKIHDGLPMQSRWQLVQRINWEGTHGLIPDGYALKCLDGDRLNCDPANWAMVSRGVLSRLNGGRHKTRLAYDAAPDELKPTVMALAKLEQGLHETIRHRHIRQESHHG
ncbi:HNH endonuclease [Aureimonas sp. N4]|uniref:HNH endonuclease n=1 Tax=Aureimonas sp. N4 TaxID=1638165 RepID=UPI000785815D|nr:HNH endonuclease [Aureimonas sp. N4]